VSTQGIEKLTIFENTNDLNGRNTAPQAYDEGLIPFTPSNQSAWPYGESCGRVPEQSGGAGADLP